MSGEGRTSQWVFGEGITTRVDCRKDQQRETSKCKINYRKCLSAAIASEKFSQNKKDILEALRVKIIVDFERFEPRSAGCLSPFSCS